MKRASEWAPAIESERSLFEVLGLTNNAPKYTNLVRLGQADQCDGGMLGLDRAVGGRQI
jgi:hypothetical protein